MTSIMSIILSDLPNSLPQSNDLLFYYFFTRKKKVVVSIVNIILDSSKSVESVSSIILTYLYYIPYRNFLFLFDFYYNFRLSQQSIVSIILVILSFEKVRIRGCQANSNLR